MATTRTQSQIQSDITREQTKTCPYNLGNNRLVESNYNYTYTVSPILLSQITSTGWIYCGGSMVFSTTNKLSAGNSVRVGESYGNIYSELKKYLTSLSSYTIGSNNSDTTTTTTLTVTCPGCGSKIGTITIPRGFYRIATSWGFKVTIRNYDGSVHNTSSDYMYYAINYATSKANTGAGTTIGNYDCYAESIPAIPSSNNVARGNFTIAIKLNYLGLYNGKYHLYIPERYTLLAYMDTPHGYDRRNNASSYQSELSEARTRDSAILNFDGLYNTASSASNSNLVSDISTLNTYLTTIGTYGSTSYSEYTTRKNKLDQLRTRISGIDNLRIDNNEIKTYLTTKAKTIVSGVDTQYTKYYETGDNNYNEVKAYIAENLKK